MASRTRPPPTRTTKTAVTKTVTRRPAKEDNELVNKMQRMDIKGKGKAKTTEDVRLDTMRKVNSASQALTKLISSNPKSKEAPKTAKEALTALDWLRSERNLDVERAAVSVLSKLVTLELFDLALDACRSIHPSLCAFHSVEPPTRQDHDFHLLTIPLPSSSSTTANPILDNLTLTYLLQALTTLLSRTSSSLSSLAELMNSSTPFPLLSWASLPSRDPTSSKQVLTRAYTALVRATTAPSAPTSKKPSPTPPLQPEAVLAFRMQGLRLLLALPNDDEIHDKVWDQAVRFGSAYSSSAKGSKECMTIISSHFSRLHSSAKGEGQGVNWEKFVECWGDVARKAGDVASQSIIARLRSGTPSEDPTPAVVVNTEKDCKALCSTLSQIETILSSSEQEDLTVVASLARDFRTLSSSSPSDHVLLMDEQEGEEDWKKKPRRYFERLRRTAIKTLSTTPSLEVVQLIEGCISVLNSRWKHSPSNASTSALIDTYIALSRSTLSLRDVNSWDRAFYYLNQAASLLGISLDESPPHPKETIDTLSFLLPLYVTLHNLSSTLYNASEWAGSIKFLRGGCLVGQIGLKLVKEKDQEVKDENGWKQVENSLWKRWELLGSCFGKIGDRKGAFDAYREALIVFPSHTSDDEQQKKKLTNMIERFTLMGCDLRLSPSSLTLMASSTTHNSPSSAWQGHLAMLQLRTLLAPMRRHRSSTRPIVPYLLKTALECFRDEDADAGVQKAGVLLLSAEWSYYSPSPSPSPSLEDEVLSLLRAPPSPTSTKKGHTHQLAANFNVVSELRIMAHLWSILLCHNRSQGPLDFDTRERVMDKANAAADLLEGLLKAKEAPPTPTASIAKGKKVVVKPRSVKGATSRTGGAAAPPPAPKKSRVIRAKPVTDKTKTKSPPRKALQDISINSPEGPKLLLLTEAKKPADFVGMVWADGDKLFSLLNHACEILRTYGFVVPRLRLLDLGRKVAELTWGVGSDEHLHASVELAREFVELGAVKRAEEIYSQLEKVFKGGVVLAEESMAMFWLSYAELKAVSEDIGQSSKMYCEALRYAKRLQSFKEDRNAATTQKITMRNQRLELAARAARVFSMIQALRDDMTQCINAMLQAYRLWNRVINNLARLTPQESQPQEGTDPFCMASLRDALPEADNSSEPLKQEEKQPPTPVPKAGSDGTQWRLSSELLNCQFTLADLYLQRGSPREAQHFVDQAVTLAESLGAPAKLGVALMKKAEIQLGQGQMEECTETIERALEFIPDQLSEDPCSIPVYFAELKRLCGDFNARSDDEEAAKEAYNEALQTLDLIIAQLRPWCQSSSRLSQGKHSAASSEALLVKPIASVLRRQIWLLRDEETEDSIALLNRFVDLPMSRLGKADANALLARLTLHNVYALCRSDLVLNSIAESTISLPMGVSPQFGLTPPTSIQEITTTVENAERLFWQSLTSVISTGTVVGARESAISLALITALKTSLGASELHGPILAANLLDCSTSITLRRELLEAIPQKFASVFRDDLQWPLMAQDGTAISAEPEKETRHEDSFERSIDLGVTDDEDEDDQEEIRLKKYWESLRQKYQKRAIDSATMTSGLLDDLPANWSVVHISVTDDKNTLFISRQRGGESALVFSIPLKGRRDSEDEEEHLTFDDALAHFREIIRLNTVSAKSASEVPRDDKEARATWWRERALLDTQLRELLDNVEFCWLGAFKTILSPKPKVSPEALLDLRNRFDRVFHMSLRWKDKKPKQQTSRHRRTGSQSQSLTHVKLDDPLIECFSTLSPECRDEELEDLVYFILDLYQYHGVPVAISEVDLTQVVVDLRTILEDHAAKLSRHPKGGPRSCNSQHIDHDEHTFLVLDKNVGGLPWENIPMLRGRSVSRIPNVDFLLDRMQLARDLHPSADDRVPLNPRNGFCILNPSIDLKGTEERFRTWAQDMKKVGWGCVVGQAPTEQQFSDALREKDLVVYFGHNSGEQYIRAHKIRSLPKCAAVMLWGCSSGLLREMGDFDRVGTPYHYMVAGCPSLVANLWDVTDRELDKLSQAVLDKMNLNASGVQGLKSSKSRSEMSLPAAVAQSRDVCKLKYLTGASAVVYGIPWYL